MKAVMCTTLGGPEKLSVQEVPAPELKPGHVRVHVHAAGVNFADTLIIQGKYQVRPELPFTPGIEIAGEIAELGEGVEGLKPGQRVMAVAGTGAFAEEAVVPASAVVPLPDAMDFVTAASFPIAYGTSHVALRHRANLKAGEVLLVHGAAGGVGLTAVEIGKCIGATVIATAGNPDKLKVAAEHGRRSPDRLFEGGYPRAGEGAHQRAPMSSMIRSAAAPLMRHCVASTGKDAFW